MRGFTLVEIIVVVGIFGILALAGTNVLIQALQGTNRAAIENEVRQNGARLMQDLVYELRRATAVSYAPSGTAATLTINGGAVVFAQDASGRVTKNGQRITSEAVAVCQMASCGATSCSAPGMVVACSGSPPRCQITLTIQQKLSSSSRSDFCAKVTLTETATGRQY
jgi:prepilin-type N-terminal cleavage/methylation domain-containing protein